MGRYFLKKNSIQVIVNEWSGEFGREMAEYFLRPAKKMQLRRISLPHGYIIWRNSEINQLEGNLWVTEHKRPDFSGRNNFSTYVVQNEEARRYYLVRGVWSEKLEILGSARFCPEWFSINYKLTGADIAGHDRKARFVALFFVPDWEYNVNRQACVMLIKKIAAVKSVSLMIKMNTRGTGSFYDDELDQFRRHRNVTFPNIDEHSTVLIKSADIVVNFASSIGLEAILQKKPVCNPVYLNGNTTIFDGSGIVFDAMDDNEVLHFFEMVRRGEHARATDEVLNEFLEKYILGGEIDGDVLQNYVKCFSKEINN
jgi:hypothetical protein